MNNKEIISKNEQSVGIEKYSTDTFGIGGKIKLNIADFIVREITKSGETLTTYKRKTPKQKFNSKRDRCTTFILIKKNTDTILASKIINSYFNVPMKSLRWAGIKDHTAITAQQYSVLGDHIEKLHNFKHDNITITNIRPSHDEIELGGHWGNYFSINIRQINKKYDKIENNLEKWSLQINERGFPNYFGMQRFGKHRPNSHKMGKKMFLGDFKGACEEFLLTIYPLEYKKNVKFRKFLKKSKDFRLALSKIPNTLHYEKIILAQLAKDSTDYKKAMLQLPISLVNLILSSYQSYLFNKAVSARMKMGLSLSHPVNGDIVSILKDKQGLPSLLKYLYQGGDGWNDSNIEKAFKQERATIIAPIIGFKTNLSEYQVFKPIYEKLLEEENFSLSSFRNFDQRLFSFEGTFRALINKPKHLKLKQAHIINKPHKLDSHGVNLKFSLPKGTYATQVLSELQKITKKE